ncbi:FAD-dependent oxidoreductase [Mycobacterium avium subsp. hominissuis]|uniref:NAD(P)/FAD-dependent oxidoreductase n=1 Tax=Mycobacterium avium TaxID=1764 RepID=UPI000BB30285|nr:FAD-dependent oxidoreductase [Mycobacterium avium]PBJ58446.1 FAD-dependent oxidoreductase [Mycobacterium avium subsp. hominissuis]
MASATGFVIIGGGLAAAKAVDALRDNNFDGRIIVFADEEHLPYERPPLSKEFLAGKKSLTDFTVQNSDWYRDNDVDLRTYEDAVALNSFLGEGKSLAVVGAGWIGLEVAAAARQRGVEVTVVEAARQPLTAALGETVGEVFATLHREHRVDLRLETQVREITRADGSATGLRTTDGSAIPADAVLVAVGARPNIELAEAAGLSLADGGVLVDASLRTSDPDIYAVGDIAAAEHPLLRTRIRTEHWANALKQPAIAVAGMLGRPGEYDELPYFFTDQYDLGMEYVGHAPRFERVVFRGDVAAREFVAFWLDADDRVLAGMNVNIWDVLDDVKALIRSRAPIDADRLGDPGAPLGELLG